MNEIIEQHILSAGYDGNHYLIVFNVGRLDVAVVPYIIVPDNDPDRSAKGLAPVRESNFVKGLVWLDTRKTVPREIARFIWGQLTQVMGFVPTTTEELFGRPYHIVKSAPEQSAPVRMFKMSDNKDFTKISTTYALEA